MGQTKVTNVTIAGLGGQGVLKASDILAEVAFESGLDVKKAEVHGMSQRGGFVNSDVRFGSKVQSPMIPAGAADFLVLMAEDQESACHGMLSENGRMFRASQIDTDRLPNRRSINVAMLGLLSTRLDFPVEAWQKAIRNQLKPKLYKINLEAFQLGRDS
jgi:indolepyruvate ferredoxin oxidoreductase, beta subunit